MTIHFLFDIPSASAFSADQIKTFVADLIPTPPPADLKISVSPSQGILITYSVDYPTNDAAAAAALNALKGLCPS